MTKESSWALFSLVQGLPDSEYGVWCWEPDSDSIALNETCARILGCDQRSLPTCLADWERLLHPEDLACFIEQKKIVTSSQYGEQFEFRFRLRKSTGRYVGIYSRGFVVSRESTGWARRIIGFQIPLELFESAQNDLLLQHERMSFALDAARDGLWDWNPQTGDVYFSPRYIGMLGYTAEQFPPHVDSWISRVHKDDLESTVQMQMQFAQSPAHGEMFECVYRFLAVDGSYRWILGRGKVTRRDREGRAIRIVGLHTDITELRETQNSLTYLVNHDALTQLYSRFFFDAELKRLDERYAPTSFICADVDGLKLVNDHLGHDTGDALLRKAALILENCSRPHDVVARTGGDEFTILLPCSTLQDACAVIASIRDALQLQHANQKEVPVFLSLGAASTEQHPELKNVLIAADKKMIEDKDVARASSHAALRQWIQQRCAACVCDDDRI